MMKTEIFMAVTAVISVICFNFNKIIDYCVVFVCTHMNDSSVFPIGPYKNSYPIKIENAASDGNNCINKLKLILSVYWDYDIGGVDVSKLECLGKRLVFTYHEKGRKNIHNKITYNVNLVKKTVVINNGSKQLLSFDELVILQ